MMISLNWLRDYVDVDLEPEALADRLTLAGLETETIEEIAGDVVIELETTSNRPDHLGHYGVAREVAWICGTELRRPDDTFETVDRIDSKSLSESVILQVDEPELCPRYTARMAFNVEVKESPEWLRQRIEAIGLRPVNNVVDITNYVLFEWGQPLHAFDYDRLEGGTILVRRAAQSEGFTAINAHGYELGRDDLVIADAARPVAVAGVMGGQDSEVQESTKRVLLESAWFHPISVRRTSRRLGLASDSSYRFERRVDPQGVEHASKRFCHLLQKLTGATILSGELDALADGFLEKSQPCISLRSSRATQVLGVDFTDDQIRGYLSSIGFEPTGSTGEAGVEFRSPSYRGDVTREIDLVEEVARVHGLDQIPEAELSVFPVEPNPQARFLEAVKRWMVGAGFQEALTFSFVDGGDFSALESWWNPATPFEVRNPVRSAERYLRRSLLPNLLKVVRGNHNRGVPQVRLFELSRVYLREGGERPREALHLAWAVTGDGDFRAIRGVADGLREHLRLPAQEWDVADADCGLVPGRSASLIESGERRALVGAVEVSGVAGEVWCGEVALEPWFEGLSTDVSYHEFSRFPTMARDLNLVLADGVSWGQIEQEIRGLAVPDMVRIDYVDTYRGKQIPAGMKSLTLSLLFQSSERTLTGAEADERTTGVVAHLKDRLGAELRQ